MSQFAKEESGESDSLSGRGSESRGVERRRGLGLEGEMIERKLRADSFELQCYHKGNGGAARG